MRDRSCRDSCTSAFLRPTLASRVKSMAAVVTPAPENTSSDQLSLPELPWARSRRLKPARGTRPAEALAEDPTSRISALHANRRAQGDGERQPYQRSPDSGPGDRSIASAPSPAAASQIGR